MVSVDRSSKVYVAGHRGLVGSAIVRALKQQGFSNLLLRTHAELDLTDSLATDAFFGQEQPAYIYMAAAKVGGIKANSELPADFLRINQQIQTNVIDGAHRHGCKKMLFLGSSCIYPRLAPQPIKEEYLLTGPLEPTNFAYAIAKISGLMMCHSYNLQHGTNFIGAMPCNVFGVGDNFDLATSHVLSALIKRFDDAKRTGAGSVELWGTGAPLREFIYADDLAAACLFLMDNFDATAQQYFVNVGVGKDISIADLANKIRSVVGVDCDIRWNSDMPDGMARKVMDVSRLHTLGWQAPTPLDEGIRQTYAWYQQQDYG